VSGAIPDLKSSYDVVRLQNIYYGEQDFGEQPALPTPIFGYKHFIAEETRLLYRGHQFSMSEWPSHLPPKFIQVQGRPAKEEFSIYNDRPVIHIQTRTGAVLTLDACPCGGRLMLDGNCNLYCEACFEIYNDKPII